MWNVETQRWRGDRGQKGFRLESSEVNKHHVFLVPLAVTYGQNKILSASVDTGPEAGVRP